MEKTDLKKKIYDHAHESPLVMTIPLFILAVGSIFSGIIFADYFIGYYKKEFWEGAIVLSHSSHKYLPFTQSLISKLAVAFGIFICVFIYSNNKQRARNISYNLDPLYSISKNKWYIDELYDKIFVNPSKKIGSFFWKKGDIGVIDKFGPDGISKLVKIISNKTGRLQTGFIYDYAFVMLLGL